NPHLGEGACVVRMLSWPTHTADLVRSLEWIIAHTRYFRHSVAFYQNGNTEFIAEDIVEISTDRCAVNLCDAVSRTEFGSWAFRQYPANGSNDVDLRRPRALSDFPESGGAKTGHNHDRSTGC